jgi:hypothetical protein
MKKITRTRSLTVGSKFVHFANKLEEIREIDSCIYLTSEEKSKSWWSSSEKSKMMARHEKIVNRMESGKPCKENHTYRGLEAWTEEGTALLDEVINRCVDAVLTEQEHQWLKQKDNFEKLATVSRSLTAECAKRARESGKKDEDAAREAIADAWADAGDDGSVCSVLSARKNRKSKLKTNYETLDNPYVKDMEKKKAKKAETGDSKQEPSQSTANRAEKMPESQSSSPNTEKKKKIKKKNDLDTSRLSQAAKVVKKKKKAAMERKKKNSDSMIGRPGVARSCSDNSEMDKTPQQPTRGESISDSVTSSVLPSLESFSVAESTTSSFVASLSSFTSHGNMDDSFSSNGDSETPSTTTKQSCDPPGRRALSPVSETRASRMSSRVAHKKKKPTRKTSETSLISENSDSKKSKSTKKSSSKSSSKRKKDEDKNEENSIFSTIIVPQNAESMTSFSSGDSLGCSAFADTDHKTRDFVRIASFITGDRTYHFRKYPNVFVGSEVVGALVNEGVAATREEAVALGRKLQHELGLFRHVFDDHEFSDKWLFFRFRVTVLLQYQQNAGLAKQDSSLSLTQSLRCHSTHS